MLKNPLQKLNLNSNFRYLSYLLLLLPVFIFRDFTPPNELKYISIVEEALREGTWFTFYNHGEIYADKPPLFFWLLMLVRQLTGGYPMWALGLLSLLPAIGVLVVMDRWMRMTETRHNPIVSNLLLLTTVMFTGGVLVMRMDMLMGFFIVLSLYTFFRIYKNEHAKIEENLLPVYIFLAVFTKGAMGFLIPLLSITVFLLIKKRIRTFGHYLGWKQWGILLGLCAVWFTGIYLEGGMEYLNNILFKQTIGRGINSFHHKKAVWYYFPRMLWTFTPWIFLYLVVAWKGIRRKMFTSDTEKFFATIVVSNIIMMSLISSKLDIYLLPIYPFVVYLCSALFCKTDKTRGVKATVVIPAAIFAVVFPAFLIGIKYIPYDYTGILPFLGTGILTVAGISGLILTYQNQLEKTVIHMGYGLLFTIFICSFMIPQFNHYIGLRKMAESAKEKGIENYAYYKFFTAPNMDVYLHCPVEYIDSVEQLDSLERLPYKTILFVRNKDTRREEAFGEWTNARSANWSEGNYRWYTLGGQTNP